MCVLRTVALRPVEAVCDMFRSDVVHAIEERLRELLGATPVACLADVNGTCHGRHRSAARILRVDCCPKRGLPASGAGVQCWADPAVVGGVEGDTGRHDLVDAVENICGQLRVGGGELRLQMVHGSGADDGGGDRGVAADDEGYRELDERDAGVVGELGELFDGVELALVPPSSSARCMTDRAGPGCPARQSWNMIDACPCGA